MSVLEYFQAFTDKNGPLATWLILFVVAGMLLIIGRGFFRIRKIQPNGFTWKSLRYEMVLATINLFFSALLLGGLTSALIDWELIQFRQGPVSWWVIAFEYALYFFLFDTYFYWFHRLMHIEPFYKWIHKPHHHSVSPNVLTTLSVSPQESLINGGFVPLFTAALTVHESTMALIGPTNIIMGLYVHCGYEFFPRWWNRSWLTKWFITTTFHDQHHRFFTGNYGGYTTIWDRICGTVRPNYLRDFDRIKGRLEEDPVPAAESAR